MTVFEFDDYKKYVLAVINAKPGEGRGMRSAMAQHIRCQTAFISQVLNGRNHFSAEQAERLNHFFGHSETAGLFFIFLVQHARAGTLALKSCWLQQMNALREKQRDLKARFGIANELTVEDQHIYFSAWYYAACHALVAVPAFSNNQKALAKTLNLPYAQVQQVLEFLVRVGLLEMSNHGGYLIAKAKLHLGSDSTFITKHHFNWRIQALQSIERNRVEDLHYSSVVSMGKKDVEALREMIVQMIVKVKQAVDVSEPDGLFSFSLDLFEVGRS